MSNEGIFRATDYLNFLGHDRWLKHLPVWIYQAALWAQAPLPLERQAMRRLGILGRPAKLILLRTGLIIEKMIKTEGDVELMKMLSFHRKFSGDGASHAENDHKT